MHAREVLSDCEAALEELRVDPKGAEWRRRWVTAVTLLRAVGHVLHKIDEAENAKLVEPSAGAFARWEREPRDAIWRFIDDERNQVIKQYRFHAGHDVTVRPGEDTTYQYRMTGEHFAGRDPRDVVAEAIAWWHRELDAIDREAGSLPT